MIVCTVHLLCVSGCFGSKDREGESFCSLKSNLLFFPIMENHDCSVLLITTAPLIQSHLEL